MRIPLPILAGVTGLLLSLPISINGAPDNPELQALVDQLRTITDKARQQRAADRWLLNELDALIEEHEWPWRNILLKEDFSDGNYDRNPAWDLISGQFWVDSRLGLRSRSEAPAPPESDTSSKQQDLGKAILGALLQEALKGDKDRQSGAAEDRQRNGPAEIQLAKRIPTVFALQLTFSIHTPPQVAGELAISLLRQRSGESGYQLLILSGDQPTLELLSKINGRTRIIDRIALDKMNDGGSHILEWRRSSSGMIDVIMDGRSLVQNRDHTFRNPFSQLSLLNRSGDFAVSQIILLGE